MTDLRFAIRGLSKCPGFVATAVLTLAFGIGVNANIFSMLSVLFLQPLPVRDSAALVAVLQRSEAFGMPHGVSYPDFEDYRQRNRVFEALSASLPMPVHLGVAGEPPERTWVEAASPNYFDLAGVPAAVGRTFREGETKRMEEGPVVVLSYRYWQRRFGGNPEVVGRAVQINGQPFTVIGVAAEKFGGMQWSMALSAFVPASFAPQFLTGGEAMLTDRGAPMWRLYGRLKRGVALADARMDIGALGEQLRREYPDQHKGTRALVLPEWRCRPDPVFSDFMPVLAGMFGGMVALVLFIACANVANLMFSRALTRQRELSLRAALGASRWHLMRQLLVESLLLAAIAGVVGMLFAEWAGRALMRFTPQSDLPIHTDYPADWRVYVFTALIALVAGVATGILPALHASKFEVFQALKEVATGRAGRRRHPWRNLLVVGQVTLSLVVLICAGLFLRSLARVKELPLAMRTDHVLLASVDLGLQRYSDDQGRLFHRNLLERAAALPGVEGAGLVRQVPFDTYFQAGEVLPEGGDPAQAELLTMAGFSEVSANFHVIAGTPILSGRGFQDSDGPAAPRVAVVNETMARQLWPNQEPVGRRFRLGRNGDWIEVVGVVPTGRYLMYGEAPRPFFYLPLAQRYTSPVTLFVRTSVDPSTLAEAVRRAVYELDSDLPVYNVRALEEHLRTSALGLMPLRMGAALAGVQGLIGLSLAVMGLYAVVSYSVAQRTQEIGVRMALGAQARHVLTLVVHEGLRLTVTGVILGWLIAAAVSVLFAMVLYGIRPLDPPVFAAVTVLLLGVAGLACYLPARRATRIDPMEALRWE